MAKYSQEDLENALTEYWLSLDGPEAERKSLHSLAKQYGIPKSTLQLKAKNPKATSVTKKIGQRPNLPDEIERALVGFVVEMALIGVGVTRAQLIESAKILIRRYKLQKRFKKGCPTPKWIPRFLNRHKLSLRKAEPLDKGRANVTREKIIDWFENIEKYLRNNGLENILQDPSRIWNADETGVKLDPGVGLIIAPRGMNNVVHVEKGRQKKQMTVLATISARGDILPPFILYPYSKRQGWMTLLRGINYTLSGSGWMTANAFLVYLKDQFLPKLQELHVEFPVLLFIDGVSSHLSIDISEFCKENGIILLRLLENASHILQPADVSVFKSLKVNVKKELQRYSPSDPTNVFNFADRFLPAWQQITARIIQNGFRKSGLFPWDSQSPDYSKVIAVRQSISNSTEQLTSSVNQPDETGTQTPLSVTPTFVDYDRNNSSDSFSATFNLTSWKLAALEREISPEVLDQFKRTQKGSEQIFDNEYVQLYKTWKGWYEQALKSRPTVVFNSPVLENCTEANSPSRADSPDEPRLITEEPPKRGNTRATRPPEYVLTAESALKHLRAVAQSKKGKEAAAKPASAGEKRRKGAGNSIARPSSSTVEKRRKEVINASSDDDWTPPTSLQGKRGRLSGQGCLGGRTRGRGKYTGRTEEQDVPSLADESAIFNPPSPTFAASHSSATSTSSRGSGRVSGRGRGRGRGRSSDLGRRPRVQQEKPEETSVLVLEFSEDDASTSMAPSSSTSNQNSGLFAEETFSNEVLESPVQPNVATNTQAINQFLTDFAENELGSYDLS